MNTSLAQTRMAVDLNAAGSPVASGQLTAFVRPSLAALDFVEQPAFQKGFESLRDKVAVVVGASRGLGAALAVALAEEGATVLALSRSEASWSADIPSHLRERISFRSGNAADPKAMEELACAVAAQYGRLDYLVCSAFPPIPSLRLEPTAAARISTYLTAATELVLHPLCAFLPQLNRSSGTTVLISSSAVDHPVRDWPHYVAAKSAVESLGRVAPMQYPGTSTLIVRPERLATEMTNTPMGRKGALAPLSLAREISRRLVDGPPPGTSQLLNLQTAGLTPEMVYA